MTLKKLTAFAIALSMTLFLTFATGCGSGENPRERPVNLEEAPGGPEAYPPDFE